MGVDISGRNPIHRTPKHDYPNWNELSDKERDDWFEMDEKWHKENPGDYSSLMKYSIETRKQNKKLTGPIVLHDKLISTKVLLAAKTL